MKRTTVFLEEDLQRELRIIADYKKVPAASILREALDQYLHGERGRRARTLRFLAVGRSGTRKTADRHEELLWKDLEPHGEAARPGKRSRRRS